jgi:hypothetical protein
MSLLFLNTIDGRYNARVAGLHLKRRRVEKSRAEIVSKLRPLACANRLHSRMRGTCRLFTPSRLEWKRKTAASAFQLPPYHNYSRISHGTNSDLQRRAFWLLWVVAEVADMIYIKAA